MANNETNWFLKARLKTRQLLLLVAIDDERNIHRAADLLHMTQPAASKQLKDLEDMLGVALFERHPRGMSPTSYGEAMIRHARMALTSLSQAHDDILALKSGLSGQVDVGMIMTPGITVVPKAIAAVKGFAWTSPRGPVSIDPKTREIVQNVYIRRVETIDGKLGNKPIETFKAVVEPWHVSHPQIAAK